MCWQGLLLNDEIENDFEALLNSLLTWEPKERITAAKALNHRYFSLDIPLRKYKRL